MNRIKEISNKIVIIKGNLLDLADEGYFDIICHGCNCQNMMGAGIARQIKERYPEAFLQDQLFFSMFLNQSVRPVMLGKYSYCTVKTTSEDLRSKFFIFNLYTQYHGGANFSIDAFKEAILSIDKVFKNQSIGLPWIGCGIGGLKDNNEIINVLKKCKNNRYHIVELE